MADASENLVLTMLRDIRQTLGEHSTLLKLHSDEFKRIHKQLEDLSKLVRYSLGPSTETQFRQTQQQSQLDSLFGQLEKLVADHQSPDQQ